MFDNDGDLQHLKRFQLHFSGVPMDRKWSSFLIQSSEHHTYSVDRSASSTRLRSLGSSVLGWAGVDVGVFLLLPYSHTGLDWAAPGA